MIRYYDPAEKRILYVSTPATSDFWDSNWEGQRLTREQLLNHGETEWSRITTEFLKPEDGPILEGGCGPAAHVAALRNAGYETTGVDFAQSTVNYLNQEVPELDIRLGDVRKLDLADDSYAGYWSLGVIEHFWDGYQDIAVECYRVLKPGGILFLAFPYTNPLRLAKAKTGAIPTWDGVQPENFYQFALNPETVERDFCKLGFEVVERRPVLARQGLVEECPDFSQKLQALYDNKSAGLVTKVKRRIYHSIARRLMKQSHYSDLLILRKA